MHGLRLALFGTAGRRWLSFAISVALFYGLGAAIHHYIDMQASSPGLSFVLVGVWVALGAAAGLCTTVAFGDRLYRGFSREFLRDEMAELDARISGAAVEDADDDEALAMGARDGSVVFGLYFLAFSAAHVLGSNALADGFMSRYSHPGVAVVHMRSDDPAVRRQGMNMLAARLDFEVDAEVERVVLEALEDPDEGVAARAAFVAGSLSIDAAAESLARLVVEREAVTFAGLISLGQIGGERARTAVRGLADDPVAMAEPQALALALGMLEVPAVARLKAIRDGAAGDDDTRLAAVWALARLKDRRLFDDLAAALEDPALAVRCAAAYGLRDLVVLESYEPLTAAFEKADPMAICPEKNVPVQEGGGIINMVPHRNYMLVLLHGLASTDHPALMRWLVEHQDDSRHYTTGQYMKKIYDRLKDLEKSGKLNHVKRRLALKRAQEEALRGDAGAPDAPDAPDGGGAPADGGAP